MQRDPPVEHGAAERTGEASRLNGRAVPEEGGLAKPRRANALRDLLRRERNALLLDAELPRGRDRPVDRRVLERSRRDLQVAGLAEPDVLAALRAEGPDAGDDALGHAAELEGTFVSEHGAKPGEMRPVAVQEAAVAPARPPADDLLLEDRDPQRRVPFAQSERRPETRVAAAHDRDVDLDIAPDGRRLHHLRLLGERLLQPPRRREPGSDGQVEHGARLALAPWRS